MRYLINLAKRTLPTSLKIALKKVAFNYREISFKPYIKKKNVEGVEFDFWIGDTDGRDWYDINCTDPVWIELRFLRDHIIEKGGVILECGAHHGCTTVVLSRWISDDGKIIAFEPVPRNCDIIRKNIELNTIKNINLINKAVGAETGYIHITGLSNSSIYQSNKGIEVELTCLDEYEHLNPTFLKIDVEGFEVEVLRGAKKILSKRPKLAIEIHTDVLKRYNTSVKDLFSFIDNDVYDLWVQWHDEQEPIKYDMKTPITKRVHLFCLPK